MELPIIDGSSIIGSSIVVPCTTSRSVVEAGFIPAVTAGFGAEPNFNGARATIDEPSIIGSSISTLKKWQYHFFAQSEDFVFTLSHRADGHDYLFSAIPALA